MIEIFRRLHHICIIVHDVEASVKYYESVGVGPWRDYPPRTQYAELDVPNREAFFGSIYKLADIDNVQIQLCQPTMQDSPQRRFLNEKGEGVFHVGFEVPDCNRAEEAGRKAGLGVFARGRRPDRTGFAYFDTAKEAGVVLEIRSSPPAPPTS
jgi:catechol 2,3-dioxygenase-like lactoylglutathione lyase family enzyme